MSTELSFDFSGNEKIQAMLQRLSDLQLEELAEAISTEGANQTTRRILEERTAPSGEAWPEWSEAYAGTRHSGQDLLQGEGWLLKSIRGAAEGAVAVWGADKKYAALHNFGGEAVGINVPARKFLGLSADNQRDIEQLVEDFVAGAVGVAA